MKRSKYNKLKNADAKAEREMNAYYLKRYGLTEPGKLNTQELASRGVQYRVLSGDAYALRKEFKRLRQR